VGHKKWKKFPKFQATEIKAKNEGLVHGFGHMGTFAQSYFLVEKKARFWKMR